MDKSIAKLEEVIRNLEEKTKETSIDTEKPGNNSGEESGNNSSGTDNLTQTGGNNPMVGVLSAMLLVVVGAFFLFNKKKNG